MADGDRPGLDPRFDPAFQRGFAGAPEPAQVPRRETQSARSVEPSPRVERPPLVEPTPQVELVERRTEPAEVTSPQSDIADDPAPHRGNPWLRALWIIAGVFTVGGLAAQWHAQMLFTTPNTENTVDYYVLPGILGEMSPWFTFAGLIAGVGAVFLQASRWRDDRE